MAGAAFGSGYDPEAHGARCSVCPLFTERMGPPVPPELPASADVVVVGQEPGWEEVKASRPFVGRSGRLLDEALERVGRPRHTVAINNAVLCMPPGGDISAFEARLDLVNRRRAKAGEATIPRPTACCAPRLHAETRRFQRVIPVGNVAAAQLVPGMKGGGIMGVRGKILQVPETVSDPWLTAAHAEGSDDPVRVDYRLVPGRKLLPTLHPAHVLREPKWIGVFVGDLARAWRFFESRLLFTSPQMLYRPEPAQLEHVLRTTHYDWRGTKLHVYDVETDGIDPMVARLRCIGIGTPAWAAIVPLDPVAWRGLREGGKPLTDFYTLDNGTRIPLYTSREKAELDRIIRWWAHEKSLLKAGHNAGSYDRIVMECQLGLTPAPLVDTILLHRSVQPDLPHDLGFVGSHFTDVHNWKADHTSTEAKTDEELWRYNGLDITVNAQIIEPLMAGIDARDQHAIVTLDHESQDACVGMHYTGMLVDQVERERQDVRLRALVKLWTNRARLVLHKAGVDVSDVVARTKKKDEANAALSIDEEENDWKMPEGEDMGLDLRAFNPLSHPQLRSVLFEQWNLSIPTNMKREELYTKSGEISTGDSVLRRLLMTDALEKHQRMFIHAVRMCRRWGKMWGTYVHPWRPLTGDPKLDKGSVLWPDGRVHPTWNCHTPITGRFASTGPNAQNLPPDMKALIIAQAGCVLVGADLDQIEFRIAASLWKVAMFLEAFGKKLDPYQFIMRNVFGNERFEAFSGWPTAFGKKDFKKGTEFEAQRKLSKQVHLSAQYAASLETQFRLITSAEDKETGELTYASLEMSEVAGMSKRWLEGAPEYKAGWAKEMAEASTQGYLREPVTGRRRDFPQNLKLNMSEVVNFKVQAGAAGVMNKCLKEIKAKIPFGAWGRNTGIMNQCHDAITVECAVDDAPKVYEIMANVMNRTEPAFPDVPITTEVQIGAHTVWDPKAGEKGKGKHVPLKDVGNWREAERLGARSRLSST